MFVLRNKINHELFIKDIEIDVEFVHRVYGCEDREELQKHMHDLIAQKKDNYDVDDWEIIEINDKLYHSINHHLNNDTDYKAYYYNSGVFEILNTRTGRLTRHEQYE